MTELSPFHEFHLERLKTSVLPEFMVTTIADWLMKNTFLAGHRFSFKDHEYQKFILDDPARIKIIKKCSQVGISELSARIMLAFCNLNAGVSGMYVLPTATFAQTFSKTRIDPVIQSSPALSEMLVPGTDSSLVKRFFNDSFIYFKGASVSGQAISVPVDCLIIDEKNFAEDQSVLSTFQSRLTHSRHKNEIYLSTPTLPNFGISDDYNHSKQFVELQKCNHCNHWFKPNYYKDVILPGLIDELEALSHRTRKLIEFLDVRKAYLACPKCRRPVDQDVKYREWNCVNPDTNFEFHGFHVGPWSAPASVTPGDLVKMSTKYKSRVDFVNFALGEDMENAEASIGKVEAENFFTRQALPESFTSVMGIDMGGVCHIHIARVDPFNNLFIVHSERVPLARLKERKVQLQQKYGVITTVIDSMPYTDMVMGFQEVEANCWAATAYTSRGLAMYNLKEIEKDPQRALDALRQVQMNRNRVCDAVVEGLREGSIIFRESEEMPEILEHLCDPKRVKVYDAKTEDFEYRWVKSESGDDHYFFTLLFVFLAAKIRVLASSQGFSTMAVSKFQDQSESKYVKQMRGRRGKIT